MKIVPQKFLNGLKLSKLILILFDVICRLSPITFRMNRVFEVENWNPKQTLCHVTTTFDEIDRFLILFYWIKSILKNHVTTSADAWVKIETCSSVSHISGSSQKKYKQQRTENWKLGHIYWMLNVTLSTC